MNKHKYNYNWTLKDSDFTKDKGTVFSCFSCGGGSTMGYKLAGFDVIGCNEIDPKMMKAYIANHNPKYSYLEPIQDFKLRKDLPEELYDLDILDGSPPCSSFSMVGAREKGWGESKKFKEGQQKQVLDNLFFDFIDLAKELQPKTVIAENVKGLLLGNAKKYVGRIYAEFDKAGYYCNHYLLDASVMGVPQHRERVFFICLRKDLIDHVPQEKTMFHSRPYLDMEFNDPLIAFRDIEDKTDLTIKDNTESSALWNLVRCGEKFSKAHPKGNYFGFSKAHPQQAIYTIVSNTGNAIWHYSIKRMLNKKELMKAGSFPADYDFTGNRPQYIIGMSVPPVMAAQIASRVLEQWLSVINKDKKNGI